MDTEFNDKKNRILIVDFAQTDVRETLLLTRRNELPGKVHDYGCYSKYFGGDGMDSVDKA